MTKRIRFISQMALSLVASSQTYAQTAGQTTPTDSSSSTQVSGTSTSNLAIGLSVPESPAFTVLGLNPQKVTNPQSPAALATALLNGFDQNGNLQSGFAIDTAPYLLLKGSHYTIDQFRDAGFLERALVRTSLSIAGVKGSTTSDPSAKLSVGLRTTLIDDGDPRSDTDFDRCMAPAMNSNDHAASAPTDSGVQILSATALTQAWNDCKKQARARDWNKFAWDVGAAISANSSTGSTSDFKSSTKAVFTSMQIPLGDKAAFALHLEYTGDQLIPDPNNKGAFLSQNAPAGGAKFTYGITSDLNFSLSGAVIDNKIKNMPATTTYQAVVGSEFKLGSGLWLQIGVGGSSKSATTTNQAFVLSQLKFSFFDDQASVPPPDLTRVAGH